MFLFKIVLWKFHMNYFQWNEVNVSPVIKNIDSSYNDVILKGGDVVQLLLDCLRRGFPISSSKMRKKLKIEIKILTVCPFRQIYFGNDKKNGQGFISTLQSKINFSDVNPICDLLKFLLVKKEFSWISVFLREDYFGKKPNNIYILLRLFSKSRSSLITSFF